MRVGILHFTAPPIVGGVEQLMATHARLLAADGHEVTLLAGRGRAVRRDVPLRWLPLLDSKNARVLAVGEALTRGEVPETFQTLADELYTELVCAFEQLRLEVCIVHNALTLHFNLSLTAALHRIAASGIGPRIVGWCHDLAWTNPLYLSSLHQGFPWDLLRNAWPGVRYVAVSEDRRVDLAQLTGVPSTQLAVVPAGVDPAQKLALRSSASALVERLGLFDADPFLLLPVRITRRKNIEFAIRVVASLRGEQGLSPTLVVTGPPGPHNPRSGDYVDELLRLRRELAVEANVRFLFEERDQEGSRLRVPDRLMEDFYRVADVLFLPSSQEGYGIPILEAGIAHLPVFCADIPPFRETAGDRAHFFDLSDAPSDVAGRIATFCRSDEAHRLRKHTLQHYSWARIYQTLIRPLLEPAA